MSKSVVINLLINMTHRSMSEVGVGDAVMLNEVNMDSFLDNLRIRYENNIYS